MPRPEQQLGRRPVCRGVQLRPARNSDRPRGEIPGSGKVWI